MASFKTFLEAFGKDFLKVVTFFGSAQGQAAVSGAEAVATVVTSAVNPAAGAALAGIEALVNGGIKSVVSAESLAAAAGAQANSGPAKLAAVVASIAPNVQSFLVSIGITSPETAQVQAVSTAVANGVVAILNSIPAPAATPAA